ncbi:MAG: type II toxin-antitoxin system Phd/YefM family antitoxin [Dehalococcoidia bacterium]|nr:type II toxin-antitoxin system Phd/YefM family antitoxin [Dehalococcoidia bacterium]
MTKKILAATEVRKNLREVLNGLSKHPEPYYITQRSRPTAVLIKYEDYESLVQKAKEWEELKSALRWNLGFIANISAAMELEAEPAKYIQLLETGIRQGLKRGNVPKGVLNKLEDAESVIKEWDFKTFRLLQNVKLLERTKDSVVLGRSSCPYLFDVMRQQASFHIKRINWRDYRGATKKSVSDFLCLCCSLCSSVMVDWLSDGKFLVAEIPRTECKKWTDICVHAVRVKNSLTLRKKGGIRKQMQT